MAAAKNQSVQFVILSRGEDICSCIQYQSNKASNEALKFHIVQVFFQWNDWMARRALSALQRSDSTSVEVALDSYEALSVVNYQLVSKSLTSLFFVILFHNIKNLETVVVQPFFKSNFGYVSIKLRIGYKLNNYIHRNIISMHQ